MRITGGKYKRRVISAPKGRDVRPTSDKVRQAVFNILLQYGFPEDADVLDVFCGTGILGLEALSRGAGSCIFIDNSKESLSCSRDNIEALGAQNCICLMKDIRKIGSRPENRNMATLLFMDPPYRLDLVEPSLQAIIEGDWLATGALCVIECEKDTVINLPEKLIQLDQRYYGDSQILLCRYG